MRCGYARGRRRPPTTRCTWGSTAQPTTTADRITQPTLKAWSWTRATTDGPTATVTLTAGAHVLNVWMREDGFALDRIVLASKAGYVPGEPPDVIAPPVEPPVVPPGVTPPVDPPVQPPVVIVPPSPGDIKPGEDIQARINAGATGTVFTLKAGMHRLTTPLAPKQGQTFVGEAGAIVSGARLLTTFSRSGTAWVAAGQTQQGTVYAGQEGVFKVCQRDASALRLSRGPLYRRRRRLTHVASVAGGGPGKWFFDYGADRIYFWDDPTGKRVETSVTAWAFGGTATDVTLRSLTDREVCGARPDRRRAPGRRLDRRGLRGALESLRRRRHLLRTRSRAATTCITTAASAFHGSGRATSWSTATRSPTTATPGSTRTGAPAARSGPSPADLTVRGNFSHHNLGPGLWTDINNIHTLYEENLLDDNDAQRDLPRDQLRRDHPRTTPRAATAPAGSIPYWTTNAGIEVVGSRNVEVYGNTARGQLAGHHRDATTTAAPATPAAGS